jgi:hypothetical protein
MPVAVVSREDALTSIEKTLNDTGTTSNPRGFLSIFKVAAAHRIDAEIALTARTLTKGCNNILRPSSIN